MGLKIQDWHNALIEYINQSQGVPFEWGKHDCVTFAGHAVEAMIGKKLESPSMAYYTRTEAVRYAQKHSFSKWLQEQVKAYEVVSALLQPGDILILKDGYERCYVVAGRNAYAPLVGGSVQAYSVEALFKMVPGWVVWRFD